VPPRLTELGFVPGTEVMVLRRAPLGDPIEIELRGYRVCLRRQDLATLCVTTEGAP
jgi:ferrous iron transport protein A